MANPRDRRDFSRAEAAELITYDPQTGIFRWVRRTRSNKGMRPAGHVAGGDKDGYVQIPIFGRFYRAHHLAWLFMTGEWPPEDIDVEHRDRNRSNNAWANLRLASRSQNNMNAGLRKDNKSGHRGVGRRKDTGKWYARIAAEGRLHLLGHFDSFDEALSARLRAEQKHYGEFAAQLG